MSGTEPKGRFGTSVRLWRELRLGILLLGLASGTLAQAKGLYYGSALWEFIVLEGGGWPVDSYT